jgi:hypothetical protein
MKNHGGGMGQPSSMQSVERLQQGSWHQKQPGTGQWAQHMSPGLHVESEAQPVHSCPISR